MWKMDFEIYRENRTDESQPELYYNGSVHSLKELGKDIEEKVCNLKDGDYLTIILSEDEYQKIGEIFE